MNNVHANFTEAFGSSSHKNPIDKLLVYGLSEQEQGRSAEWTGPEDGDQQHEV